MARSLMNWARRYALLIVIVTLYCCFCFIFFIKSEPPGAPSAVKKFDDFYLKQEGSPSQNSSLDSITPVLVLACNRSFALKRVLTQLFNVIGSNTSQYPVTVSLDCRDRLTEAVARSYSVSYMNQPDQSRITTKQHYDFNEEGYHRLSRHYRWALDRIVNVLYPAASTIIILEDDLDLSPDLFDYFASLKPMLLQDRNVLCVSGFNDNGKEENVDLNDPCRLWWTDFFPGLGWMTTTQTVRELLATWPKAYWDDWLREPNQRRNRACIRPEISKTITFGKVGVSDGQFFDQHLGQIVLNDKRCWYNSTVVEHMNLARYTKEYISHLENLETVDIEALDEYAARGQSVKIICKTKFDWARACRKLAIMDDIRAGVARNSFQGAVPTFYGGVRVFVVAPTPKK